MATAAASSPIRNASLADTVAVLQREADSKYDVIVPASRLRSEGGLIHVVGGAAVVTDEGVGEADAVLRPTKNFDGQVADKLGIPVKYIRRLRDEAVDLYDTNVNYWLAQAPSTKHLVRAFHDGNPDNEGVARALLSNSYGVIDDLDVLAAVLSGVTKAGLSGDRLDIKANRGGDRFILKIGAPEISVLAPELLRGYTSPFSGNRGADNPTVFAGLVVTNSETGGGAFTVAPEITFEICTNGYTITKHIERQVHLGSKLDEGVIKWSKDTATKTLELVTSKTSDAVKTFLSPEFLQSVTDDLAAQWGNPVEAGDVVGTIERVGKALAFTETETAGILADFISGGQLTSGGVASAITAFAQRVEDPERAYDIESSALNALTLV